DWSSDVCSSDLDVGGNPLQLGAEHVRIAVDDLRLLHQLLERATPLGLETLAHAALRRLRLGALDLEAVTQLAALVGRAAQASHLRLQLDRTFGGLRQGVVQSTQLDGNLVALCEHLLEALRRLTAQCTELRDA